MSSPSLLGKSHIADRVRVVGGGGPFCDQLSGPQQYFLTKLPTDIQFLGSRPAEVHVFVNFARREVCTVSLSRHYCNSTLGYVRQVLLPTKKKTHLQPIVVDCPPWSLAAGFQQPK
jgi:hypothetical protein